MKFVPRLLAFGLHAELLFAPYVFGRSHIVKDASSGPRFRKGVIAPNSLHPPGDLLGLYYDIENEGLTPRMYVIWSELEKREEEKIQASKGEDNTCKNR